MTTPHQESTHLWQYVFYVNGSFSTGGIVSRGYREAEAVLALGEVHVESASDFARVALQNHGLRARRKRRRRDLPRGHDAGDLGSSDDCNRKR